MDSALWITSIVVAVVAAWAFCGWLSYGLDFAYFQREYPAEAEQYYASDRKEARIRAIYGPIALGLSFVLSGFGRHGLKWR